MKSINIKYAGYDSGYDSCKLITNIMQEKNQEPLIYPSLAKESVGGLANDKSIGMNEPISKEAMLIKVKDQDDNYYNFMIGEYVITQLETGGTNYDVDKYNEPSELAKLLAGLSVLHPNTDQIVVDTLVIGLPIQHYQEHKEAMTKRFTDSFESQITNQEGNIVTIRYEFKNVIVMPQGLGALMYYMNTEEGQESLKGRLGILDIGGRTTDIFAYNNNRIIEGSPYSINIGMSNVFRSVSNKLNLEENLVREAVIKGQDSVRYNQKEIGITSLVEEYSENTANNIAFETRNKWRDFIGLVDKILIIGGASEKLKPYINPAFNDINVELLSNTQTANVLGYLLRGQDIYNRKNNE